MKKLTYDSELFKHLEYSAISKTGLRNKITGKDVGTLTSLNGKPASSGVKVLGTKYICHRVIWVLVYGSINEELEIDHIDGNPWNNRVENLRIVTKIINQRNRKKYSNNTSGVNGTFFREIASSAGNYNEYVGVRWMDVGRERSKCFNIKQFPSRELALEFGELFREMVLPEKETYTERHGI